MPLVRRATKNDAAAILDITKRAFVIYKDNLKSDAPVAALSETLPELVSVISGGKVFVITGNDGIIIGTVRYDLLSDDLAYISRFAVDPAVSSLGAGSDLLSHCIDDIHTSGCKAVALHTNSRYFKLARYYYGKEFFVHSTDHSKGYIRALFVKYFDPEVEVDITPALSK